MCTIPFLKKKIKSEKYYVYVSLCVYRENSGKTKTGLLWDLLSQGIRVALLLLLQFLPLQLLPLLANI